MIADALSPELLTLLAVPILGLFGGMEDDVDDEGKDEGSQVRWLRSLGDREALAQIMQRDRDPAQGLDAAGALAELGDVRGLDHLIGVLNSPHSRLRQQAAEILMRINHPRGLRALKDRPTESGNSSRDARRDELYKDLKGRKTDELIAIWHEHDRSQWSGLAFEVMEAILIERLGKPPPEVDEAGDRGDQDIDPSVDAAVQQLWARGDMEALTRLFEDASDTLLQLEAAEALADLGDEDALDVLIEALDDPDPRTSEMAAEMLDWLDLPRGNAALEERGFEFETSSDDLLGRSELELSSSDTAVSLPTHPRDPWGVEQRASSASPPLRMPAAPAVQGQPVWQRRDASSGTAPAMILTGAVGGVLGFILFRLGLHLLGLLALPRDAAGWLQTSVLYYLAAAILTGASVGSAGSRAAQAIAARFGWEAGEGDPVPVIGALAEGILAALVLDATLFLVLGP